MHRSVGLVMDSYVHEHKGKVEVSWDDFGKMCRDLALKINKEYQPDVVVGVAKAGVIPGVVIASMFRKDFYTIKISRRKNDQVVHARPILFVPITDSVYGKKVLVVDEICVTGQTMQIAKKEVMSKHAKEVRSASMFIHSFSFKPDYYAMETDAMIVNPWDRYVISDEGGLKMHPEYVEEESPEEN